VRRESLTTLGALLSDAGVEVATPASALSQPTTIDHGEDMRADVSAGTGA